MRILIDGMNLALSQGTGVATYAKNLARLIKRNGHHLTVLYGKPIPPYRNRLLREAAFFDNHPEKTPFLPWAWSAARGRFTQHSAEIRRTGKVLTDHISGNLVETNEIHNVNLLFPMADLKMKLTGGLVDVALPYKVDIAHWTYPVPARIVGAKNIYTVHDMVPLKLPYATLDSKRFHFRLLTTLARTADHLVTVSEASRRDIIEMLRTPEDRVTNTYQSVRIPSRHLDEPAEQRAIDLRALNVDAPPSPGAPQGGLAPGQFYLFVGAIEPKKNLKRTIEAYLASGVPHPLIIVGRRGWSYKEELRLIERSRNIHYLDYVPFNQLVTLIQSARALVFASLYEGFGLPMLEAFVCGTPVITAAASSTAEIAGDAALLVNPYSVPDIRDAFRRLSAPDSPPERRRLSEAGQRRATEFDEAHIAARLEDLYQRIAAG